VRPFSSSAIKALLIDDESPLDTLLASAPIRVSFFNIFEVFLKISFETFFDRSAIE
jgi:hypothetical protein